MSQEQIDQFHMDGKLTATDYVWNETLGDWKPASMVFQFSSLVTPPPPPIPVSQTTTSQITVVEGGSFKFGTFGWIVLSLIIPLWPISLPICWFCAYRSYKKPSVRTIRTITN
jgi:hypothetical protein